MTFPFKVTCPPIEFQPANVVLDVPDAIVSVDGVQCKMIAATYRQEIQDGYIVMTITKPVPVANMQQMISGYDFTAGKPSVSLIALNQYMAQYDKVLGVI